MADQLHKGEEIDFVYILYLILHKMNSLKHVACRER